MGKPKVYGMQRQYTPNAKQDIRYRRDIYDRGRNIMLKEERTDRKRLKRLKEARENAIT